MGLKLDLPAFWDSVWGGQRSGEAIPSDCGGGTGLRNF